MLRKTIFLALLVALVAIQESTTEDCWWTGCEPSDRAVIGCETYGRVEHGTEVCVDDREVSGFKYNCCTSGNGATQDDANINGYQDDTKDVDPEESYRRRRFFGWIKRGYKKVKNWLGFGKKKKQKKIDEDEDED